MEETAAYRTVEPGHVIPNGAPAPAPALLSREAILARRGQRKYELVAVPGWGGSVRVQSLLGTERDAFEDSLAVERKGGRRKMDITNFRAKLIARCVVDERGYTIFSPEDVVALGELSAADLAAVFDMAQALNGMSDDDVETLRGNSEGLKEGSTSG